MTATAEDAVRAYLRYRSAPDSGAANARATQLQQRLEETEDPLERLRLRAQIAESTDPARFEEAFIAHAKTWADEHGVSAAAFAAEGVPRAVLRRAGLDKGRVGGRRPRRTRVAPDDIRAAVPGRGKKFTSKDLQEASGGSAATVRNVLTEMIAAGEVEQLGADPDHSGPGRAPLLYKKKPRR